MIVNALEVEADLDEARPAGFAALWAGLRERLGGTYGGMTVFEVPPGERATPYHYEIGNEEWLIVLAGRPTLRTPEGEAELDPWDAVFLPEGEQGAHQVANRTGETVRIGMWSTRRRPCIDVYPDSGKLFVRPPGVFFRLEDATAAGCWDGESV